MNETLISFVAPIVAAVLSSLVTYYMSHRKHTEKKDMVFEFKVTITRHRSGDEPQ